MDRNQIMSRRNVEGLIARGHTIVIFEQQVLKLDSWMEKHPGGKLPLMQMVGVDASSEIAA
jgi:delta8-fatty-acid desaturase